MPLMIKELHAAPRTSALNEEWLLLENTGPNEINTAGVTIALIQRGARRPRSLGTLSPGFVIRTGERVRLITGSSAKKAQGQPPAEEEGLRNYHLFLSEPILGKPGEIQLLLKQFELARATLGPAVAPAPGQPSA